MGEGAGVGRGRSGVLPRLLGAAILGAGCVACADDSAVPPPGPPATVGNSRPNPTASGAVLVGAGDIGVCGETSDESTANLLDQIPGVVFTTGDNVYDDGTAKDFSSCFQPSWGRHRDRMRPAPGNHDYDTEGARGYFGYFGTAAGDPAKGYYSYNLGAWHIVVLNSNCDKIGGCFDESEQARWLAADLAATPTRCTMAYWHHPYFTSGGNHKPEKSMQALVEVLYTAGADVVVAGHNHNYERFGKQNPAYDPDDARGLRAFVVGTGGGGLYDFDTVAPNSESRTDDTHGVLKFTLDPQSYRWEFIPVPGKTFTDEGTDVCH